MVKTLSALLMLGVCLSLSTCGKKKSDDDSTTTTVSASALIIPLNLKCGENPCIQ